MIQASELITNADGSIYHLHLHPEQLADTVILVGDPDRVPKVSQYFDQLEHEVQKREFVTHTGRIGNLRLTVISTGIGTDNIDIVLNELDAVANLDLQTGDQKSDLRSLRLVRIGTSGSIQEDIAPGSMLVSTHGLGLDGLLWHYPAFPISAATQALESDLFAKSRGNYDFPVAPYLAEGHSEWVATTGKGMLRGITATLSGFYAPQGRSLRTGLGRPGLISFLQQWRGPAQERVTNFEMETAAIFGLAALMGHQASACNAILANRSLGTFHAHPDQAVDALIRKVLENISATI